MDCKLAYVMKQAGSCENFQVIPLYTKPLSENVGYKSNILAMSGYYIIVISKVVNYIKNSMVFLLELIRWAASL